MESYTRSALESLTRADDWANRDGNIELEFRRHMEDLCYRTAQIYAILAVAEQLSYLNNQAQ